MQLDTQLADFCGRCHRNHPDYITRILMLAARERDIPVHRGPHANSIWYYGWGARARPFFEAASNGDGLVGSIIARDKTETARFLKGLGLPSVEHRLANSEAEALALAREMRGCLVVKPIDQGQGRGVTVGVERPAEVAAAYRSARKVSAKPVLLERFIPGDDHRLLVVDGRLVAASRREPPYVVGDGASSIEALIASLNRARRRHDVARRYLKQIAIDHVVLDYLATQELTPDTVLAAGQKVHLRGNANVSTGGSPTNTLPEVHPEVRQLAEIVGAACGLRSVGLDYLTTDISRPPAETGGAIIEINCFPGLDVHIAAHVDEAYLGGLLIGDGPGRIPVIVVVAEAAQLAELADAFDGSARARGAGGLGLSFPGRGRIGGLALACDDQALPERVGQFLRNPACHALLIGCRPEEILVHGFPVDRADRLVFLGQAPEPGSAAMKVAALAGPLVAQRSYVSRPEPGALEGMFGELQTQGDGGVPVQARADGRRPDMVDLGPELEVHALAPQRRGPTVLALMRNESLILPHFLDHYRRLGVENFIFCDDRSTDGSPEMIAAQPDCTLVRSSRAYNERLADGRLAQHAIRDAMHNRFAPGRWALNVDLDEFLILPEPFEAIADFERVLDRRGHECVFGTMVDAYPATLAARNYDCAISPFEGAPYFDPYPGFRRLLDSPAPQKMLEGVRGRLIRRLRDEHPDVFASIFQGRGYLMPSLFKVPFVLGHRGIIRQNAHMVNRQPPFDIEVALAHFKFGPDLDGKITDALKRQQYYLGSIEYRFFEAAIRLFGRDDLRHSETALISDRAALTEAGLIRFER